MWIERSKAKPRSGVGLVELLVAMAVAGLVAVAILTLFSSSNRQMARMLHYCDLNLKSQTALDTLTRDIRDANRVLAATATSLQLEDSDGLPITYTFSTSQGTLSRTKSAQTKVLLRGCEGLLFTLGKRNPAGAFGSFPAAAAPAECKVVTVNWKCSRTLLGRKETSESMTTANIVIRRQGT